jgi:hypothetical protein
MIKAAEATFPTAGGTVTVLVSCNDAWDTTVAVLFDEPVRVRRSPFLDLEGNGVEYVTGGASTRSVTVFPFGSAGVEDAVSELGYDLPSSVVWVEHT